MLKLKLNTSQGSPNNDPPQFAADPTPTPVSAGGLKLNLKPSTATASTPTGAVPPKPKRAYNKKATAKAEGSAQKKRPRDEDEDESTPSKKPKAQQIKLTKLQIAKPSSVIRLQSKLSQPPTPSGQTRLKIKAKGKAPVRPLGVGYDSEADDAEEDPAIEDNFILRMAPGPDCNYIRSAIEERRLGVPVSQGGADVTIRFFTKDARRAVINVQGRHYAAILVDLPCIVESMKSWDRKGWWKSADICQMLMVLKQVDREELARDVPLPRDLDQKTWQWPHGLTPPMYNVRNRRFRKRVNYRTIEAAEREVERLLQLDEDAKQNRGSTEFEILDLDRMRDQEMDSSDEAEYEEEDDEVDADNGEIGGEFDTPGEIEETEEEHEARIAAQLAGEMDMDEGQNLDPDSIPSASTEQIVSGEPEAQTPGPDTSISGGASDAEDDAEEAESDEDEEGEDEEDEDARERAQYLEQQREEIAHLEKQIEVTKQQLSTQTNTLLKNRLASKIKMLEDDMEVKKRGIGEADD